MKSVSTILKVKMNFSLQNLNFSEVHMGHLHTCPLHLKLISTTSLSHILHNEETRENI